jgi:hypothetical protein
VTEDIPRVPIVINEFRLNGDQFKNALEYLINAPKPRPKLARIGQAQSRVNKNVMARFFVAPSTEDEELARKFLAQRKQA